MYSSPEILETGGEPTYENDIWGVGIIYFELLFGFNPFLGA